MPFSWIIMKLGKTTFRNMPIALKQVHIGFFSIASSTTLGWDRINWIINISGMALHVQECFLWKVLCDCVSRSFFPFLFSIKCVLEMALKIMLLTGCTCSSRCSECVERHVYEKHAHGAQLGKRKNTPDHRLLVPERNLLRLRGKEGRTLVIFRIMIQQTVQSNWIITWTGGH